MKKTAVILVLLLLFLCANAWAETDCFTPGEEYMLFKENDFRVYFTGEYREILDDPQYPMGAVALEYCFDNIGKADQAYSIAVSYLNELSYAEPDQGWEDDPVVKAGGSHQGELILDASQAEAGFEGFAGIESLMLRMAVGQPRENTRAVYDKTVYFSEEATRTFNLAAVSGSGTVISEREGIEISLLSWEFTDEGAVFYAEFENKNPLACTVSAHFISVDTNEFCGTKMIVEGSERNEGVHLPAGTSVPVTLVCPYVWSLPGEARMGFQMSVSAYPYANASWISGRIKLYSREEKRIADTRSIIRPLEETASKPMSKGALLFVPGEELLIADNNQFSVYLTGEYRDAENDPACPRGTVALGCRIENHGRKKAEIHYMGILNGAEMVSKFTLLGKAVSAGKSYEGELVLTSAGTGVYFETLADLEAMALVIQPFIDNCYEVPVSGREVRFSEAAQQTANFAVIRGNEHVLISEQGVTVRLKSWLSMNEYILLHCEVDNQSPEDICFNWASAINGYGTMESASSGMLASGQKCEALIPMYLKMETGDLDSAALCLNFYKNRGKGEEDYDIRNIDIADYFSAYTGRMKFYASEGERAADTWTQFVPLAEKKAPYRPPVDPMHEYADRDTIRRAQEAMNDLGYECGTPDGVSGKKTRAALSAFQKEHGLAQTGSVTHQTAETLAELGYEILGA